MSDPHGTTNQRSVQNDPINDRYTLGSHTGLVLLKLASTLIQYDIAVTMHDNRAWISLTVPEKHDNSSHAVLSN